MPILVKSDDVRSERPRLVTAMWFLTVKDPNFTLAHLGVSSSLVSSHIMEGQGFKPHVEYGFSFFVLISFLHC